MLDPKNVALSMIVHGDLFWIHVGRALQVASPEQINSIKDTWPEAYAKYEKSATLLPYQYKLSCQFELVIRSLKGKSQNWKSVCHHAKEMDFIELAEELEKRSNYRLLLDLARRFGVSKKDEDDLIETAVG